MVPICKGPRTQQLFQDSPVPIAYNPQKAPLHFLKAMTLQITKFCSFVFIFMQTKHGSPKLRLRMPVGICVISSNLRLHIFII